MLVSATVHPGTPESAMHHPNEPGIACRSVLRIYNPPDAGELLMSRPSERYLPIASHDRVPPRFHVAEYVTPLLFQINNPRIKPLLSSSSFAIETSVILSSIEILSFTRRRFYRIERRIIEFERRREILSSPLPLFFLECLTSRRAHIYIFIYIV